MDPKLVQLYFSKLENLIENLRGNQYSNERLNKYQENLFNLFEVLKNRIDSDSFLSCKNDELISLNKILQFVHSSIIYLDDSTLNQIPYETVHCLEQALSDWTDEEYIIVTSLQYNTYFFHGLLAFWDEIYQLIKFNFNIEFESKLIQISIPKYDVNDYLLNIVLYHELGHFIERKYKIANRIIRVEFNHLDDIAKIKKYHHYSEYFADVFAAQYINSSLVNSLDYLAPGAQESTSHPSNEDRKKVINDFIKGNKNEVLDNLKKATEAITNVKLRKRFKQIKYDDFYEIIPTDITEVKELHALYVAGWDIWLNYRNKFENMSLNKQYKILNNLIEKSISNYMVSEQWNKNVSAKK